MLVRIWMHDRNIPWIRVDSGTIAISWHLCVTRIMVHKACHGPTLVDRDLAPAMVGQPPGRHWPFLATDTLYPSRDGDGDREPHRGGRAARRQVQNQPQPVTV